MCFHRYDYLEFTDARGGKTRYDTKVGTDKWPKVSGVCRDSQGPAPAAVPLLPASGVTEIIVLDGKHLYYTFVTGSVRIRVQHLFCD